MTLFCMDYLGGAMFTSVLLKAHPSGWGAGFFDKTFGNCWPAIDKLAASGKCPLIRIHGPWTNHAYNPAQHDKDIYAGLAKTKQMAEKYPRVEFQYSPVCESDGRGATWRRLFSDLKQLAGTRVVIVCSVYKGEILPGFLAEIHGNHAVPYGEYQYGYDGTNTVDSNVQGDKERHGRARAIFFWHPAFNLKYKTKLGDKSKEAPNVWKNDTSPPKERVCKPTVELILSLAVLASDKGPAKLKPRNLWKSHADRHNTPIEDRAYKPVLISPNRSTVARLVDENGIVIAKSGPPFKYNDGRWAYRFPNYGYQISNKVLAALVGSVNVGQVNPAFREGEYRS